MSAAAGVLLLSDLLEEKQVLQFRRLLAVKHELFVPVSSCSHVGKVSEGCFVLLFVANLLFSQQSEFF